LHPVGNLPYEFVHGAGAATVAVKKLAMALRNSSIENGFTKQLFPSASRNRCIFSLMTSPVMKRKREAASGSEVTATVRAWLS